MPEFSNLRLTKATNRQISARGTIGDLILGRQVVSASYFGMFRYSKSSVEGTIRRFTLKTSGLSSVISSLALDIEDAIQAGQSLSGTRHLEAKILAVDDKIIGSPFRDILYGRTGNDRIKGGSGDDVINGRKGIKILHGDRGSDRFVLDRGSGYGITQDFKAGIDELRYALGLGRIDVRTKGGDTRLFDRGDLVAVLEGIS